VVKQGVVQRDIISPPQYRTLAIEPALLWTTPRNKLQWNRRTIVLPDRKDLRAGQACENFSRVDFLSN